MGLGTHPGLRRVARRMSFKTPSAGTSKPGDFVLIGRPFSGRGGQALFGNQIAKFGKVAYVFA